MFNIGDFVLIRTNFAGIHFGTLFNRDGMEITLTSARRLWSWEGALSLSEVAMNGIDIKKSKISVSVDAIIITAIEIISISKKSNLPGNVSTTKSTLTEA